MVQDTTDSESKSTIRVVQEAGSQLMPDDAHVLTAHINPPGLDAVKPRKRTRR